QECRSDPKAKSETYTRLYSGFLGFLGFPLVTRHSSLDSSGAIKCESRALAGARGAPATPAGVRFAVALLPGGSLRSPPANFLSPRWGGIRDLFMKRDSLF